MNNELNQNVAMQMVRATAHTSLPSNPDASDTAMWYRLGDAVENHGRHMKRQAVAAEYNSGRDNMAAWYRELGVNEQSMKDLLGECRTTGLLLEKGSTCTTIPDQSLSESLPTARAAREYAKAEPEVKEVIKEIIREDPEAEIKAAQIKQLRAELAAANALLNEQPEPVIDVEEAMGADKASQFGFIIKTFADHFSDYTTHNQQYASREQKDRHDTRLRELASLIDRHLNKTHVINPTTIDI